MAFFNAKINFFIIILIVPSAMSAFLVSWLTARTRSEERRVGKECA